MNVYEVVVSAVVTNTFRVIAQDQKEATECANRMFSNENFTQVYDLQFEVHQDQYHAG